MKNPLLVVSELFGAPTPNILASVTLDSCYDHVREDYAPVEPEVLQHIQHDDFETPGIQEIE